MPEEAADADVLQRESTIFVFEMTSVVSSPAREAQPFGAPGIPEFCGRRGRQAQCPGKCQDPSSRCHFDLAILYVMLCKGENLGWGAGLSTTPRQLPRGTSTSAESSGSGTFPISPHTPLPSAPRTQVEPADVNSLDFTL